MTRIIDKRLSLGRNVEELRRSNTDLNLRMEKLHKLAGLGTAACMIAHEINNLLTPIGSYAALALENMDDSALVRKALEKTVANCQRTAKVTAGMLSLANGDGKRGAALLKKLVDEVFDCLCRDFSKDGITVRMDIASDLEIYGDSVQIQHLMLNLILNARDAMGGRGGIIEIAACVVDKGLEIKVRDTGEGIAASDMDMIFEPFFSTKSGGRSGCGLGLAFCKRVVESHGGRINAGSQPGGGTIFTVFFPGPEGCLPPLP